MGGCWIAWMGVVGLVLASGSAQPQDEGTAPGRPAPRLLGPRRAPERARALRRNGGNRATEKAVELALEWLARHQQEDGSWDADGFSERCEAGGAPCEGPGKGQHGEEVPCPFDAAISALATLAFLGHGHLPDDEDPFGAVVARALPALEEAADPWSLALSTQVFAEVEAVGGNDHWHAALSSRAQRLLERRQEDGGWGYVAPYRPGSDVPYTALVVQALVAAGDAGIELPADLAGGVDGFLGSLEVDGGKLAYLLDGRRYGYTPTTTNGHLAAAIRELLAVDRRDARHRTHLALLRREAPVWKISFETVEVPGRGPMRVQVGNLSMYQWWYGTEAAFQVGGSTWSAWFGKLKKALVDHQSSEGCERGSWDPAGTYERQTGGRVFATALGALMLEQPYRHRRMDRRR